MADLLVLRVPDAETLHAPEFEYLLSLCENESRAVFDNVETRVQEADAQWPRSVDAVLVLGPESVFVGRASLEAMWCALREGASEVWPHRLAEVGGELSGLPLYTMRGYEHLEKAFLENPSMASAPTSRRPVALVSRDRFIKLSSGEDSVPPHEVAHAGLCHVFTDYYGEVRDDVTSYFPDTVRDVLDIGCGRGATGRFLKERFDCRVTGVELNPLVAREAARHLYKVIHGDIETARVEGCYDVVLALDIVEHLVSPHELLTRVPGLLTPGGRAILSIPNVGHYSVVEDLVAGRWDYVPMGLLCYTHVRFFTRRTLEDLLSRSGIVDFEIFPRKTELPSHFASLCAPFTTDLASLSTEGFYVVIRG